MRARTEFAALEKQRSNDDDQVFGENTDRGLAQILGETHKIASRYGKLRLRSFWTILSRIFLALQRVRA
jgi:hypothetical protein